MSFKDGRIGLGKDPIFPLDISGSCRIDGDLILGGRFSDAQGNAIQLGSGSGATSTPDQSKSTLPSWNGGTITTQGLGIFKGQMDESTSSLYITGDNSIPSSATGTNNTTLGFGAGIDITSAQNGVLIGKDAGANITTGNSNTIIGRSAGTNITTGTENVMIGILAGHAANSGRNVLIGHYAGFGLSNTNGYNIAIGYNAMQQCDSNPTHNICMGHSAGMYAGADNSIFIGREAGKSAHPVGSNSGDENIGIGAFALNKVTSGAENVVIGSGAGNALTSATRNTILGFEAGKFLTSSGSNVMIGARAGINSTAAGNTFVGTYAGNKNTSGNENTSIGYWAGYNLTTGTGNTIMGYQAGYSHTTGHSNVLIGENCGYNHTTPSYNTFIGYNVGMNNNNSSGSNVFIGKSTAYYNNGCFNVALGKEALMGYMSQGATRSGDANVAIGYQAAWRHDGHGNVIIGPYSGNQSTTIAPSSIHDNVCVGIYTGTKLKNSKGNVFIGPYAGQNFTRATSVDGYNTFVGYYAGKQTTTGTHNVAIGAHALRNHTTGLENVAVGREAGTNITSAGDNVCIGAHSGAQITTGNGNVCLGWDAGGDITTGYDNIAIGRYCCREGAVTGGYNIMMGYFAGHPLTSGASNVGIGNTCLRNITSGNYNTCVGISCGRATTTGNNNTFYGNAAGYSNTTGYQNIAIGYNANYYETTGDNNIAIGHHAGCASGSTNNDYKLYINTHGGYYGANSFIYGHGKMDDNPFITFNCDVGIGTTSPEFHLDIRGSGHQIINVYSDGTGEAYARFSYNNNGDAGLLYVGAASNSVYLNSRFNYPIIFYTDNVERARITNNGRFCIGGTGANTPFNVHGYVSGNGQAYWISRTDGWWGHNQNYTVNFGAEIDYGLWVGGALGVASDIRIKTNIVDVPDNEALEMLRDIPCRYYEYKDKVTRGTDKTIGFIAQEVREKMPMAVSLQKSLIPNEMRKLKNISWEKITDNSSNTYKLTSDLSNCSGIRYRFFVSNDPNGNDEIQEEIIGNHDDTFTFEKQWNNVFCYGREVDDFHVLDKQKLFAINFSATQELDRKVIALEAKLAKLEAFLGI
tara:strand:+ start:1023 stop:4283 length:3261 start_codon:yes stop_codon:yes gene_type:complete